jgi:Rod binding domain-containing protein
MSLINSQTHNFSPEIINDNTQIFNNIKNLKSQREQLKRVSTEFEAIIVTKMLNTMDKTVDKEGGLFGEENKYMEKFKSHIFTEMGREIAKNPNTSVGFAKQIYMQMEKSLPKENVNEEI